mgnify:CR=1 FL=1
MQEAILLLEDGRIFKGFSLGAIGQSIGEVCFNTGMTGYQEILTDPSYCSQIVAMTSPHIGNYGINNEDVESSKIQVSGFIIKEETLIPSNWRSIKSIGEYLKDQGVVGIKDIDTRALTIHLRDNGSMNGIISSLKQNIKSMKKTLKNYPQMKGLDLVKKVTTKKKHQWTKKPLKFKVAVIDFGVKYNILRILEEYGCQLTIFPADITFEELKKINPDGIFLSNGPGDPSVLNYAIKLVKSLLGVIPIFGICLGHQILANSLGAKTYKLKFGHRGINHPVKNLQTESVEITSQNHGFAVDLKSLPKNTVATHINLNDNTCAGINCLDYPAFSVQYHPESSPGPHDSRYVFEKFIKLMEDA